MSAKIILEVVSGPLKGQVFAFDSHDMFLFGRKSDCHARLPQDDWISRHHFILEANPPDARIRDLGSQNGTFVNGVKYGGREAGQSPVAVQGRRYPEIDLKHGDQITVGKTTIEFKVQVPEVCCRCGVEMSNLPPRAADGNAEKLCPACTEQYHNQPPPKTMREMVCERCGKVVTSEVGRLRGDEYICQACQTGAMNAVGGLKLLIQGAAKKAAERGAPSIDGYELTNELGRGGMGVVYRAARKADGLAAAVKVMLAKIAVDEARRKEFLREVDVTRQLQHPNVVQLMENGCVGGAFYFVMELCSEGSIDKLMFQRGGRLDPKVAVPIILQCLDGLGFAHQRGFIHRDLKPQNILLDRRADTYVAKISDFGLAKSFAAAGLSGMTATGSFGGTFQFMPREQLTDFKYARPVSDLWSLAATLYCMMCGQPPLEYGPTRDPIQVLLHDEPVPLQARLPKISPTLATVVDRALSSAPARRFQTAAELKHALQVAVGS